MSLVLFGDVVSLCNWLEYIRYATANNITFLAKSGGHGLTSTLARVRKAIMIDMRRLNWTSYNAANGYLTVGGGITTGEMANATHALGKEISRSLTWSS